MVRLRNFPIKSCHPARPERRREYSSGSAFLRSIPASSCVLSDSKADSIRHPSAQIGPPDCRLSPVNCQPRSCFPSCAAAAACATGVCGSSHQYHSKGLTLPLFSYSYTLFCTAQNAISNPFCAFRTLRGKHRAWDSRLATTPIHSLDRQPPREDSSSLTLFLDAVDAASSISPLFATLTKNTGGGGTCLFPPGGSTHSGSLRYPLPLSCFPPPAEAARPQ
jgi:hypothetical protein